MRPGDKLTLYQIGTIEDGSRSDEKRVTKKVWTVIKEYPHFVLCKDRNGIRECFSYWHIRKYGKRPVQIVRGGETTLAFT